MPQQQQQMPQQQQMSQQQQMPQQQNNTNGDSISGYFNKEMGGSFSDNYSFLEGDSKIEHSFTFLESKNNTSSNENNQQSQLQPQMSNDSSNQNNMSKGNLMDKAYEQMMLKRGSDMPQGHGGVRV